MFGFKNNDELSCVKKSYIPFNILYERYGHRKSYRFYHEELAINSIWWIHRRVYVFIVCFLGLLIFQIQGGKIHTRLPMIARIMMKGIEGQTYTIIPMIVAEIYQAMDRCKHEVGYFEGSNLLLQIWFLEHIQRGDYCRDFLRIPINDYISKHCTKKMTFAPERFARPTNAEG